MAADCEGHAASHNFLRAQNKSTPFPSLPSLLKGKTGEKLCVYAGVCVYVRVHKKELDRARGRGGNIREEEAAEGQRMARKNRVKKKKAKPQKTWFPERQRKLWVTMIDSYAISLLRWCAQTPTRNPCHHHPTPSNDSPRLPFASVWCPN